MRVWTDCRVYAHAVAAVRSRTFTRQGNSSPKAARAPSNRHITQSNGRITQSNRHITQSNRHITQSNRHITQSNRHITQSNGRDSVRRASPLSPSCVSVSRRERLLLLLHGSLFTEQDRSVDIALIMDQSVILKIEAYEKRNEDHVQRRGKKCFPASCEDVGPPLQPDSDD
ncbi:hypothetical protein EYF80_055925 [Liparis tanakae]|uniref:Uncharacterized protein n=1 Tax=Liparis tanakae TaxID=230148 RepID=A0A4Z2F088_9TELE|nr:hypothetical protein EYF80_055925 [Liparis tanakae]